jgi:hypothetical protein
MINFSVYTHISHFAMVPYENGSLHGEYGMNDAHIRDAVNKTHLAGRKIVFDVGGAGAGAAFASATMPENRQILIQNIIRRISQYGYDGVSLDWEGANINHTNYFNLVKELRTSMNTINPNLLLFVDVATYDNPPTEVKKMEPYVDVFNMMTYWGAVEPAAKKYIDAGVSPLKIAGGIGCDTDGEIDLNESAFINKTNAIKNLGLRGAFLWTLIHLETYPEKDKMRAALLNLNANSNCVNGAINPPSCDQCNPGYVFSNEACVSSSPSPPANSPVGINGPLYVCGKQLCNQYNLPIQLRGMSTHGLQWYGWQGSPYCPSSTCEVGCLNDQSLDVLANGWNASVMRVSMYVEEGGYNTNPSRYTAQVQKIIDELTERGLYVLVDFHMLNPGDPNDPVYLDSAKDFFTNISKSNKDRNNVLYDICNEPNGVSWDRVKEYADVIIPLIRANDPDSVILVGTHGWASLGVSDGRTHQDILSNPISYGNVMYAFHFYAASHKDSYRQEVINAYNAGLPIFITEWGTQTYTGDGANDFVSSDLWIQLARERNISWTSWNYADDFRSGSSWKVGTCGANNWVDSQLKEAGLYVKGKISSSISCIEGYVCSAGYSVYKNSSCSAINSTLCSLDCNATTGLCISSSPSSEIIIDNGQVGTSSTGTWQVSSATGAYGANSLWSGGNSNYTYNSGMTGNISVYAYWTYYGNRVTAVPIEIYDGNSLIARVSVNQRLNASIFNLLGTYAFSQGARLKIVATGDGSGSVSTCADAVKFVNKGCGNGAINYPDCNQCAESYYFSGDSCLPSCVDSDGGVNPFVYGVCKDSRGITVKDSCLQENGAGPVTSGRYAAEAFCLTSEMIENCKKYNSVNYCDNLPRDCYRAPLLPLSELAWTYFDRNDTAYVCPTGCSGGACTGA